MEAELDGCSIDTMVINPVRVLSVLLVAACCGLLMFGGAIRSRNTEIQGLQSDKDALEDQLSDVRSGLETVRSDVDSMTSDVSRFGNENWQDVVPDVETDAASTDSDLQDVENKASADAL